MNLDYKTPRLNIAELSRGSTPSAAPALLHRIVDILSPVVVESLPPYFHGINSPTEAQVWLDKMLSESRLFAVYHNDEIIGFLFVASEDGQNAHIGYLLGENYWGQGFAGEFLQGFIEQASKARLWHKLIGGVDIHNRASAILLLKRGFVKQPGSAGPVVFYEYQLT